MLKKSALYLFLPYFGLIIGTLTGLLERSCSSQSVHFSDPMLAKEVFFSWPFLQALNTLKQQEIKHFSLFIPLLPLAIQIILGCWNSRKIALRKYVTKEQVIYFFMVLLGILLAAYRPTSIKHIFNPSGHIMLKVLTAALTVKTLTAYPQLSWGFALFYSLYALTDIVFIHITVSTCHTIPEILAGFAIATCLLITARTGCKNILSLKTQKFENTLKNF